MTKRSRDSVNELLSSFKRQKRDDNNAKGSKNNIRTSIGNGDDKIINLCEDDLTSSDSDVIEVRVDSSKSDAENKDDSKCNVGKKDSSNAHIINHTGLIPHSSSVSNISNEIDERNDSKIRYMYMSQYSDLDYFDGSRFFMNRPQGTPKSSNNITLDEIIPYKRANSFFFSSFGLDADFFHEIVSKIPKGSMKTITLVMHTSQRNHQSEFSSLRSDINLAMVYPNVPFDYGSMHSKLWMFEMDSSTFLRIVVGSANMSHGDFHIWNQNFWIQDFPLKTSHSSNLKKTTKDNHSKKSNLESDFERDLLQFLDRHQTKPKMNFSYLRKYDFSRARGVLIASVPGYHRDKDKNCFGHPKIQSILQREYKKLYNEVPLMKAQSRTAFYQSSSIGSITKKFVDEMKQSLHVGRIRIVYPTINYVDQSKFGRDGAGCLFLKKDIFQRKSFPRDCFMRFQSYNNQIAHSKHSFCIQEISSNKERGLRDRNDSDVEKGFDTFKSLNQSEKYVNQKGDKTQTSHDPTLRNTSDKNSSKLFEAWCMIGSHNFSSAALGQLQKSNTQVFIRNYELSILLPPQRYKLTKEELLNKFAITYNPNTPSYSDTDEPYCLN